MPIRFTEEDGARQFEELKFKPEESSIDLDPATKEGREGLAILSAFVRLFDWAGTNRTRLAVIPAALGQDDRTHAEIARTLKVDSSGVTRAICER